MVVVGGGGAMAHFARKRNKNNANPIGVGENCWQSKTNTGRQKVGSNHPNVILLMTVTIHSFRHIGNRV